MSAPTDTSLTITRLIKADPPTVFRAWTSPTEMRHWAAPAGATVADVEVDLRVGGAYRIRMRLPDGKLVNAVGAYRAIDPPHKLVYTWDWEEPEARMGETLVTVDFNEVDGGTEVVLTHERFPTTEQKTNHEMGWTSCLERLERRFA